MSMQSHHLDNQSSISIDLTQDEDSTVSIIKKEEEKCTTSTIKRRTASKLSEDVKRALSTIRSELEAIRSAEQYSIEEAKYINELNMEILEEGRRAEEKTRLDLIKRKEALKSLVQHRNRLDELEAAMIYLSDEERSIEMAKAANWVKEKSTNLQSCREKDMTVQWRRPEEDVHLEMVQKEREEELTSKESKVDFDRQMLVRDQEQHQRDCKMVQERIKSVSSREASLAKAREDLSRRQMTLQREKEAHAKVREEYGAVLQQEIANFNANTETFIARQEEADEARGVIEMMKVHLNKLMPSSIGVEDENADEIPYIDRLRRKFKDRLGDVEKNTTSKVILAKYCDAMEFSIQMIVEMDAEIQKYKRERDDAKNATSLQVEHPVEKIDAWTQSESDIDSLADVEKDRAMSDHQGEDFVDESQQLNKEKSNTNNKEAITESKEKRSQSDKNDQLEKQNRSCTFVDACAQTIEGEFMTMMDITKICQNVKCLEREEVSTSTDTLLLDDTVKKAMEKVADFVDQDKKKRKQVEERKDDLDEEKRRDARVAKVVKGLTAGRPTFFAATIIEGSRNRTPSSPANKTPTRDGFSRRK